MVLATVGIKHPATQTTSLPRKKYPWAGGGTSNNSVSGGTLHHSIDTVPLLRSYDHRLAFNLDRARRETIGMQEMKGGLHQPLRLTCMVDAIRRCQRCRQLAQVGLDLFGLASGIGCARVLGGSFCGRSNPERIVWQIRVRTVVLGIRCETHAAEH